jgi:KaiC/GvpD/RAD55 family RecA-like ATPase
MEILETRISVFKNTRETEVLKGVHTIASELEKFQNGEYKNTILKIRAGDSELKKSLPTIAFHGTFENYRKASEFVEASGIIILDIDDIDPDYDLEEIKADIMDSCAHILSVMVSPSGNGLKVLYCVNKDLINADNYRQVGKQLVNDFSEYGKVDYLSITDCLISTYDPLILINEWAEPAYIYIKESIAPTKGKLEARDEEKRLWDDAEEFFETVLAEDIESKTTSNFHYIQVAIFDLAKYGFKHPSSDLKFVIDYAEQAFKYSKDNSKRFDECVGIAQGQFQLAWPYDTTKNFEEDEEEDLPDYSEYSVKPKSKPNVKRENVEDIKEEEEDQEELDGLIDYSNIYERVLEVAKEGDRVGNEISLENFSKIFRFKGTGILTVTGIPGHGKTEFVDQCILDLARLYGEETIVAGFEQAPEEHLIKLTKKLIGTNVTCPSYLNQNLTTFAEANKFLVHFIKHIDTTSSGGNIIKILEIAAKRIKASRDAGGIPKYLVIDPFNMLSIKAKVNGHEKIEEILRRITQFSHQMGVLVILVAHPFKMKKDEKTNKYEVPDFYSVKGSSAFFEMSYHGLVVYRTGYLEADPVMVKVLKVKQSNLGITSAEAYFTYDRNSGRYIPKDDQSNELKGDHRAKDWLEKALEVLKKLINKQ